MPELQSGQPSKRLTVRAAPYSDFKWLAHRTGCAITTDFSAIQAVVLHPEDSTWYSIRGMVGYCNTTRNAVQLHMAVTSPIVWRTLLRPALEYPFLQSKKNICLGVIPEDNAKSIRFTKRAGFTEVHRVKDGWDMGVDLVVLELRKEDCRYIGGVS